MSGSGNSLPCIIDDEAEKGLGAWLASMVSRWISSIIALVNPGMASEILRELDSMP